MAIEEEETVKVRILFSREFRYDSVDEVPWPNGKVPDVVNEAAIKDLIDSVGGAQMLIDEWAFNDDLNVEVFIEDEPFDPSRKEVIF